MSDDDIPMQVRGCSDFGSPADRRDPRTPEQRAARQRERMLEEQWQRLPWSTASNLILACMLFGTGTTSAGPGPGILLGLAGLAGLSGLGTTPAGATIRRAVMALEAAVSATAIAWVVDDETGSGFLLAGAALLLSPLARNGLGAWTHLALLAGAMLLPTAAHGPWALLSLLLLVLLCVAATLRHTRDSTRRARLAMECEELEALCTQLGANFRSG